MKTEKSTTRKKSNFERFRFKKVPKRLRASGKGKLMISTNGEEGRAEIFVEHWHADYGTTTIFHLGEVPFRSITAAENGFLLDWSGKT